MEIPLATGLYIRRLRHPKASEGPKIVMSVPDEGGTHGCVAVAEPAEQRPDYYGKRHTFCVNFVDSTISVEHAIGFHTVVEPVVVSAETLARLSQQVGQPVTLSAMPTMRKITWTAEDPCVENFVLTSDTPLFGVLGVSLAACGVTVPAGCVFSALMVVLTADIFGMQRFGVRTGEVHGMDVYKVHTIVVTVKEMAELSTVEMVYTLKCDDMAALQHLTVRKNPMDDDDETMVLDPALVPDYEIRMPQEALQNIAALIPSDFDPTSV